jgi:MFS family permease
VTETFARTFASVRGHRNYRLYFAGQAVSFTGSWMQQIAASWLLLQLTHSAVAVGALALTQLLPVTVFGLFVGTLLDRFEVRRIAIATESASMVMAAILAALTLTGVVTVWEIYLFAALMGIAQAVGGPARHALVVRDGRPGGSRERRQPQLGLRTSARVLGPAIGGIVVGCGRRASRSASTPRASSPRWRRCSPSTRRSSTERSAITVRRSSGALDALSSSSTPDGRRSAFFAVLALRRSRSTSTCCRRSSPADAPRSARPSA